MAPAFTINDKEMHRISFPTPGVERGYTTMSGTTMYLLYEWVFVKNSSKIRSEIVKNFKNGYKTG